MESWFVLFVLVIMFYSAVDLAGIFLEIKFQLPENYRRKNLYVSGFLRVTAIIWGCFSLAFAAGWAPITQVANIMPAIALCLILTDMGTLKWLDSKIQG